MTHEFADGLCKHCGLPPRHAAKDVCPVNKFGEPAKRALEAVGLVYVGFEVRGMYATYESPLQPGVCERMFWPQIEKILELTHDAEYAKQRQEACEHVPIVKDLSGSMWCFICGKDLEVVDES